MSKPTQATRHIAIHTPLGDDVLLLQRFSAREEVSRLFEIDLDLLSEDDEINFDDIIGQNVTISMELPGGGKRYWNGFINRFEQGVSTSRQFAQYKATMVPWLWFLTLTSDCRIFQEKSVPDIVRQVFNDLGFSDIEDRLSPGYRTWTYCVQYRETHFNFVSRLMEQEGIYYYFLHEKGKCTIVLCDSLSKHDPYDNYGEISFTPDTKSTALQERISDWAVVKQVLTGKFAQTDYNFEKPNTSLMSTEEDQKKHAKADYEIYDYPGEYPEKSEGDKYAKVRMEELAHRHEVCTGRSDSRGICSGYKFKLTKHTRKNQNREYLILYTEYQAAAQDYETSGGQDEMCDCSFTVIPSSIQYRPERKTHKPVIQGTQTAVVTGPSGEKIYPDKYGRVKVQFHWDREGKKDEKSSCWVRVSQAWAGPGWGSMHIPHVGQEVIVAFIEGDPDRPLITGRLYNADNMPADGLPGEKTKSSFRDHGGNEQIIEGKDGAQIIHTKQSCGNEFLIDGSSGGEKIVLRDKYGNEVVMDAVAGTIRIYSPSHESEMVLGKSIELTTLSNYVNKIGADWSAEFIGKADIRVGTDVFEFFGGAQHKNIVGLTSKFIGGAKHTTIVGAETKKITGTKMEFIRGSEVKSHKGPKYTTNPKHQEKSGKMIANVGGALKQFAKKFVADIKANSVIKAGGTAKVEAKKFEQLANQEFSIECGVHDEKTKKMLFDVSGLYKAEAKEYGIKASKMKAKAKTDFNNGVLTINK